MGVCLSVRLISLSIILFSWGVVLRIPLCAGGRGEEGGGEVGGREALHLLYPGHAYLCSWREIFIFLFPLHGDHGGGIRK